MIDRLGPFPERDFTARTNADYAAWCRTYYQPEALDDRGMQSLHGLWAWQEQERRMAAAVAAERERIFGHIRSAMGHAEAGYDDVAWRLLASLVGPNAKLPRG